MEDVSSEDVPENDDETVTSEDCDVSNAPVRHQQLIPLSTRDDVRKLLAAILKDFVERVDIYTSGLLDDLIERDVINEADNVSLKGSHLPTPREKARRLWTILNSIDHTIFIRDVIPALCQRVSSIIPSRFWRQDDVTTNDVISAEYDGCVRCAIERRVRADDMADFLFRAGMIGVDTHSAICRKRRYEVDWSHIFHCFKSASSERILRHCDRMTLLLQNYSLRVPRYLADVMRKGFPCICKKKPVPCLPKSALACLSPASSYSSVYSSHPSLLLSSTSDSLSHTSRHDNHSLTSSTNSLSEAQHQTAVKTVSAEWLSEWWPSGLARTEETAVKTLTGEGSLSELGAESWTEDSEEETQLKRPVHERCLVQGRRRNSDEAIDEETAVKCVQHEHSFMGISLRNAHHEEDEGSETKTLYREGNVSPNHDTSVKELMPVLASSGHELGERNTWHETRPSPFRSSFWETEHTALLVNTASPIQPSPLSLSPRTLLASRGAESTNLCNETITAKTHKDSRMYTAVDMNSSDDLVFAKSKFGRSKRSENEHSVTLGQVCRCCFSRGLSFVMMCCSLCVLWLLWVINAALVTLFLGLLCFGVLYQHVILLFFVERLRETCGSISFISVQESLLSLLGIVMQVPFLFLAVLLSCSVYLLLLATLLMLFYHVYKEVREKSCRTFLDETIGEFLRWVRSTMPL